MTPAEEAAIRAERALADVRERHVAGGKWYTTTLCAECVEEPFPCPPSIVAAALDASMEREARLRQAARRVLDCGVGNLSQPQYSRRVEAFDLLDDELEAALLSPTSSRVRAMTLAAAAQRLGLAPTTLREQVRQGRLQATKLGRDWLVDEAEVERYRAHSLGKPGHPRKP